MINTTPTLLKQEIVELFLCGDPLNVEIKTFDFWNLTIPESTCSLEPEMHVAPVRNSQDLLEPLSVCVEQLDDLVVKGRSLN